MAGKVKRCNGVRKTRGAMERERMGSAEIKGL